LKLNSDVIPALKSSRIGWFGMKREKLL